MQYAFILGKNSELSKAEITEYLKARKIDFELMENAEDFVVIKAEKLDEGTINNLGGTLKIGEVVGNLDQNMDLNGFGKPFDTLLANLPEKALFAVSGYGGQNIDAEKLAIALKQKMKENGIKAGYVHSTAPMTHTDIVRKKLLEKGAEFLLCSWKKTWLARTVAVHNPYEFQKRDMERPVQRAIFSIPPRLARIMVNLTGCTKGILLDPFCGIGSILQEAALAGFDIRGSDIDRTAVEGCRKNLEWLAAEYGISIGRLNEEILVADAKQLGKQYPENSIDAIATEPYLGEPLKERPDLKEARKILEDLEPLYVESMREMAKVIKPKGKIIVISPFFETGDKNAGLDVAGIASRSGLRLISRYPDFEERHKTLRMINVLEK